MLADSKFAERRSPPRPDAIMHDVGFRTATLDAAPESLHLRVPEDGLGAIGTRFQCIDRPLRHLPAHAATLSVMFPRYYVRYPRKSSWTKLAETEMRRTPQV